MPVVWTRSRGPSPMTWYAMWTPSPAATVAGVRSRVIRDGCGSRDLRRHRRVRRAVDPDRTLLGRGEDRPLGVEPDGHHPCVPGGDAPHLDEAASERGGALEHPR